MYKRFVKDNRGIAAVEFALLAPILLLLFLGGFEMTRYVLVNQKLSKTTASMSDLIARLKDLNEAEISNSFNAVEHLLEPYYDAGNVKVIITSVMNDGSDDVVNWQRCGGGSFATTSAIGEVGEVANLPSSFDLGTNEDTVIAEIFYDYEPVIAPDIVAPDILYKVRFNKPRFGSLIIISDDAGVTGC